MLVAVVLVGALVIAVPLYFRWGWTRMVAECNFGHDLREQRQSDVPFDSAGTKSVSYSWQWSDGFTCEYSNGKTRSSYWF